MLFVPAVTVILWDQCEYDRSKPDCWKRQVPLSPNQLDPWGCSAGFCHGLNIHYFWCYIIYHKLQYLCIFCLFSFTWLSLCSLPGLIFVGSRFFPPCLSSRCCRLRINCWSFGSDRAAGETDDHTHRPFSLNYLLMISARALRKFAGPLFFLFCQNDELINFLIHYSCLVMRRGF